jgi:putative ABC transport system substrate-binding protein
MKNKIMIVAIGALLLALSLPAAAQQPTKVPRIGYVSVSGDPKTPGRYVEAFRQGLQELGYVEGKNTLVEYRYAALEPERVPEFVAELVQQKVNVLVSSSMGAPSAPPSRQLKRFPLSSCHLRIQLRLG